MDIPKNNGSGIYGIFRLDNGVFNEKYGMVYVGSTGKSGFYHRLRGHRLNLRKGKHSNPHLQSAFNLYSESRFEFRILQECPENELIDNERAWIAYYQALDRKHGYNLIDPDRHNMSQATRDKIANSLRGYKHTQETRDKVSKALSNRVWTKEMKEKCRLSQLGHKGVVHTAETKAKMSIANKGRLLSQEHRDKISKANTGHSRNKGTVLSKETKIKMSIAKKEWWIKRRALNG